MKYFFGFTQQCYPLAASLPAADQQEKLGIMLLEILPITAVMRFSKRLTVSFCSPEYTFQFLYDENYYENSDFHDLNICDSSMKQGCD